MTALYTPPLSHVIAGILVLGSALAAVRGAGALGRGLRDARALEVVRGIRGCVVALVAAAVGSPPCSWARSSTRPACWP